MSLVPRRYCNICLISFQYLPIRVELYLTSKLTDNTMSSQIQFERYIIASIALRYGTSRPNNS